MGWITSTFHRLVDPVAKPVAGLFDSNTALVRALANPGDAVAVGQVFDNTAVKRQTPGEQVKNADDRAVSPVVHQIGEYHQQLWYYVQDGASWAYHGVIDLWHHIWGFIADTWDGVGGKRYAGRLGKSIGHTVDKWGGERRVVAWALVVVVVIVVIIIEIVTWGAATPAIGPGGWALIMALLSFGVQQGLTPDAPDSLFAQGGLVNNNDYNSVSNSNSSSSSGQAGSFLDQLASALGNLPPSVLIGAAAVGTLGVYYLLTRR